MRLTLGFFLIFGLHAFVSARTDHYKVLGVNSRASSSEIRKAYHKLALQWHPDKNPNNELAHSKYTEITEAYATLSDPDKRNKYDQPNAFTTWGHAHSRGPFSQTREITSANWAHFIDGSDPGEVWLLLFFRDAGERSERLMSQWDGAYSKLKGIVNMGRINIHSERYLAMQMRLRVEPCIVATVIGSGNWRYLSGDITVDTIVGLAGELYKTDYLLLIDSIPAWDSVISSAMARPRVIFISDTSRVTLKFRHLSARLHLLADVHFASTWTSPWLTKQVQNLIGSNAAHPLPLAIVVDGTAFETSKRYKVVHCGTKSWGQIATEVTMLITPEFPHVTASNYATVCRLDALCVLHITDTNQSSLRTLASLGAQALSVWRDARWSLQFGWIDASSADFQVFSQAFGIQKAPSTVIFDRSRHQFALLDPNASQLLFFQQGADSSLQNKGAAIASAIKSHSKRFVRVAHVPFFQHPTLLQTLISWKVVVGAVAVFLGIVGVYRFLLSREPAPKQGSKDQAPKSENAKTTRSTASGRTSPTSSSSSSSTDETAAPSDTGPTESDTHASFSSGSDSEDDNEHSQSDDDAVDIQLTDLSKSKGWINEREVDLSSLKHPLIFLVVGSTTSSISVDRKTQLISCPEYFRTDSVHFVFSCGNSSLASFLQLHCGVPSDSVCGLILHARRGKFVVYPDFSENPEDLRSWIQQVLEGVTKFHQLPSNTKWPFSC